MLHTYRKKEPTLAEQFDGSNEMAEKYGLKKFGWRGFVREYGVNDFELGGPLLISKSDWIIKNENGKYFVLPDRKFKQAYERCD